MVESALWHPVALAGDVANTPLAVQLLDQPLVLWRDGLGGVQALADRCPHLGVRFAPGISSLLTFASEGALCLRKLICCPYDVASGSPRIIESFLDKSHFGF